MKRFLFVLCMLCTAGLSAQTMHTYTFAVRDTQQLDLDLYLPEQPLPQHYCIVYMFGGGFMSGARTETEAVNYARTMSARGYAVATIDYRLGMKGVTNVGASTIKILNNAINMAVEDCVAAVNFLLAHADEFQISPDRIILAGSSAGAITALHTDYAFANGFEVTATLPDDFRFAGIVAYSGAILSFNGKVKYPNHAPAPTLFVHGTTDNLVKYSQIQLFNIGLFGTKPLAKRFDKFNFPYYARHYVDLGHEVATFAAATAELFDVFVKNYIERGRHLRIDEYMKDAVIQPSAASRATTSDFYNPRKRTKFMKDFQQVHEQIQKATQSQY
ncbi:MAG: alpha/beta hydrolase [Paludibacteraceae bacterium]